MENAKILLVDDCKNTLAFLKAYLSPLGYQLLETDNGALALQMVQTQAPDLIITDLEMPIMHGFEMVRNLREKKISIPIIILSGNSEQQELSEAYNLGITDYLVKPFTKERLCEKVSEVLAKYSNKSGSPPKLKKGGWKSLFGMGKD